MTKCSLPEQISQCGITLDICRQRLTKEEWFDRLLPYALGRGLLASHAAMMRGDIVNISEHRAALHSLLRATASLHVAFLEVKAERERMLKFAEEIRSGERCGCRNHRIKDIINIGIGGSETGIHTVWHALRPTLPEIKVHFLSTVDGVLLDRIVAECDPYSTLVIVSSKSFTTLETQVNAEAVDRWLRDAGICGTDRAKHIVAVSANSKVAQMMCLPEKNVFRLWDWVGGRFSVWGAIGLPLMIAIGRQAFTEFLGGAEEMDRHSLTDDLSQNLPAILALLAYRNSVLKGIKSQCILPYDERLRYMVPWVQQLEMESLGKLPPVANRPTGSLVWGGVGNEGQHSFYQWLREGTDSTAIDLIWSVVPGHRHGQHHRALIGNAKAQADALVIRDNEIYTNVLTTLTLDAITPHNLGSLMAMYEHKTTMLGTLLGINAFDQPGVETGKQFCYEILHAFC